MDESYSYLDKLMEQMPGTDGYGGDILDTSFDNDVMQYRPGCQLSDVPLNTAFYHRWYKVNEEGASGQQKRHRAFSDPTVFMAQTTNPKVASLCKGGC